MSATHDEGARAPESDDSHDLHGLAKCLWESDTITEALEQYERLQSEQSDIGEWSE
jgi:hypothetical protein